MKNRSYLTQSLGLFLILVITSVHDQPGIGKELRGDSLKSDQHTDSKEQQENNSECQPDNDIDCGGSIWRDPLSPVILTPRNSAILGEELTIHWSPVENAISYNLIIEDLDVDIVLSGTTFKYDGDLLEPGNEYAVSVAARVEESNGEIQVRQGEAFFETLELEDSERIRVEVEKIWQSEIDINEKYIQVLEVYQEAGLYSDAIITLQQHRREVINNPQLETNLRLQLRQMYRAIGLSSSDGALIERLQPASN